MQVKLLMHDAQQEDLTVALCVEATQVTMASSVRTADKLRKPHARMLKTLSTPTVTATVGRVFHSQSWTFENTGLQA